VVGGWERINGSHALLRVSAYDVINTTPALTVLNNGNVGIGTTIPLAKLHITGSSSVPAAVLMGNVGIGTTSPAAKLEIIHDSTAVTPALYVKGGYSGNAIARFERIYGVTPTTTYVDINGSGGNAQLTIASAGNAFALGVNTTTSAFEISDNGAIGTNTRLLIDVNGNIGIGTTAPTARLHVTGSASVPAAVFFGNVGIGTSTLGSGTLFQVYKASGGNNWSWFNGNVGATLPTGFTTGIAIGRNYSSGLSEANLIWGHGVSSNQYFAIAKISGSNSYSEQLRININGNVGIGSATPASRLDIVKLTTNSPLRISSTANAGGDRKSVV
jgi:hypothetical protein